MSENMADKLKRQIATKQWTTKNVTAIVLFGAICLVFVFFGLPGRLGLGVGSVARVNNAFISFADFQQEEERIQQYYSSLFGGAMDFSSQRQLLRQQAIENLIRMELVSQAARHEGILATDAEVRDFIVKDIPFFQQNGQFQRELYGRYLEATRSTPMTFENKVRKDIENIRSRRLFEVVGKPTAVEEAKMKSLKENKLDISFARLEQDQLIKKMSPSVDAANKALAQPEFMKRVEEHFNANKNTYSQSEEIHAQHILIAAKQGDSAGAQAALQKINEIKKASAKEDFGQLAAKHSEDPGSKGKKGDLGFFSRGRMVKELEDVAFGLPVGQVSEPVKTPFGYHLIKVLGKKEAKEAALQEQQVAIAQVLLAQDNLDAKMKTLDEQLTKGDEAGANVTLKELGVNWDTTGYFELGAESLPKIQSPVVKEAVFELGKEQPLLKRLVRDGNFKYVLKLKDFKVEPQTATASASEDQMQQKQRAEGLYDAWLNHFRKTSKVEMNLQVLQQM